LEIGNPEDWGIPPQELRLLPSEMHLWRISLSAPEAEVAQLRHLLAADESARADRFHLQQHHDRFVVARACLRIILSRYLATPADRLQFQYGAHGKPSLMPTATGQTVQFNLAHSEDLALLAVARDRAVGVDVEKIRSLPAVDRLAQRFFTTREHTALTSLPGCQQETEFFRYWVCKEAYLKAIGAGLTYGLDQVEIELHSKARLHKACLHCISDCSDTVCGWSLWELTPAAGYAAALVAAGQDWRLSYWSGRAE
jgi:4'-phosphopantetheinyl transferase